MQKEEERKTKKKYTKMVLTKHKKLKDITQGIHATIVLGCTKFLF